MNSASYNNTGLYSNTGSTNIKLSTSRSFSLDYTSNDEIPMQIFTKRCFSRHNSNYLSPFLHNNKRNSKQFSKRKYVTNSLFMQIKNHFNSGTNFI